jgi:hypothetical protein
MTWAVCIVILLIVGIVWLEKVLDKWAKDEQDRFL